MKVKKMKLKEIYNFEFEEDIIMSNIQNDVTVKEQYKTADNLNTRISIHQKYSTNKQGFNEWIFMNYRLENGMKVLELGCGTGDTWKSHLNMLPEQMDIILTDLSSGMLKETQLNLTDFNQITYNTVDIQNIPYEDNTFDVVIANMMLYHVPDIQKGLMEVRRVMKSNAIFYCATYGENGIVDYMTKLLKPLGIEKTSNDVFTLQNGEPQLKKVFKNIEMREYEDSLAVTNIDDMVKYVQSLGDLSNISEVNASDINKILTEHLMNGVLYVPKEYGMFLCTK